MPVSTTALLQRHAGGESAALSGRLLQAAYRDLKSWRSPPAVPRQQRLDAGLCRAGDAKPARRHMARACASPDAAPAQQLRPETAASSSASAEPPESGSRTAGEAIEAGIARLREGQPQAAVDLFQRALDLPGNGAFRFSGTVREYRCPSDAEEQSALYNMACAYVAMGQADSALTCLEACMEAGFQDFSTLRQDPDLAALRGAALDNLLGRYDGLLAKVFRGGRRPDGPGTRPWYEVI